MKPSLPQGTRDFAPVVVRKRQYIFNTIREIFELYGFEPLETPAMENLETLMGKYGEEGDKLIFQVTDSGNRFTENFFKAFVQLLKDHDTLYKVVTGQKGLNQNSPYSNPLKNLSPAELALLAEKLSASPEYDKYLPGFKNKFSGKALKYDLTIPFARYVAVNHTKLVFPFKRYQIQPVWRGDKPQRGRYREFYQCDADIVGSNSYLNEVELSSLYLTVFRKLNIDISININNRKILQGIAEYCGCSDKLIDITIALDKLDKVGIEKVKAELINKGIPSDNIELIFECLNIDEKDLTEQMCLDCINISKYELSIEEQRIACLKYKFWNNDIKIGMKGCDELLKIFDQFENEKSLRFDISLARGLNYYTGTIFEVKAKNVKIGSIGGGGRYDDLTGLFGVPGIPGVGISFGVDRIYDVMEELNLFPETIEQGTKVLFFNLGEEESKTAYTFLQQLRSKGVSSEIFHEQAKMEKQFKYAEKKNIPFVAIIGTEEIQNNNATLKNLKTGEQQLVTVDSLFKIVTEWSSNTISQ